ncbi:hypothetical protein Anas_04970, partial [Armadillidium nasatum]
TEESIPIKSYQLVTDELVMEALKNDKGQEAELLSWKIKPFTKKGDNFSSIVVSIEVRYRKNGTETEDTFVAKINPLRPMSPITEAMEESYAREPIILSSIIGGMNQHLENLRLDKIRTPKLFSKNLEKGKEVIVTENLRTQGFKMHDRKVGLDFNHSILVVNEIGRLHASSVLFEEELYPKTLLETFPEFKRSFLDPNHYSFEMFRDYFRGDAEDAKNFLLKAGPKYEKCVKWLSKHSQEMVDFYIEVFSSKKPFDVLVHADCYTNNLLFKYNEDNIPVDVRLVDLQLSVKATPVADLLYFLYSSISGDFRSQNMKTLITAYYESFCNVFRRAGKKPPFTYMINPLRPPSPLRDVMEQSYTREPVILSSIIGGMNKQLANLKLKNIRTPKVLSRNSEKRKEVLISENLRNQGFKMHDRKIGLDLNHSLLVVNEIGRFHASSILFEEELYPKTLLETFPDFKVKQEREGV